MSETYFCDDELVAYIREWYGPVMAVRVGDLFAADLESETGFARSVRRSITHEMERRILDGKSLYPAT